jgi:hypothetical protein
MRTCQICLIATSDAEPCTTCVTQLKPEYRGGPTSDDITRAVDETVILRLLESTNPLWRAILHQRGGLTILFRAIALTVTLRPHAAGERTWWDAIDAEFLDGCSAANK